MCCEDLKKLKEKTSSNHFWICEKCKITVEILYAMRDPK